MAAAHRDGNSFFMGFLPTEPTGNYLSSFEAELNKCNTVHSTQLGATSRSNYAKLCAEVTTMGLMR